MKGGFIVAILATQFKNPRFREKVKSPVTSTSNNVMPTVTSELLLSIHKLFFEMDNSTSHLETVCNYRIKYIIFKSSSLKSNEIFHYDLYLIEELPVCGGIEAPSLRP